MAYVYIACAVCVTIFSTGDKLILEFYRVTNTLLLKLLVPMCS